MKVTCKRENLVKGLNIVSRMVKQRATLPVLGNILLSSDDGRLKLSVTDLEASIVTWIGAKIDEEGAITVPARTFFDYLSASSDEVVSMNAKNSDVALKSARSQATIKGILAEEFPIIPHVNSKNTITIPAVELKNAIFAVSSCAAPDETRPVLSGILFRALNENLYIVATDSYRLSEKKLTITKPQSQFADIIIPQRTAIELARILPDDDQSVVLSVGENQAQFVCDDIVFLSRQIEGNFPDYQQIIPKEMVYEFEVEKSAAIEAIKVANVFARDIGGNIKFTAQKDSVEITSVSAQTGDTKTTLDVSSRGKPITVAFNARYIMDALSVIGASRVRFSFSGELNPGQITALDDQSYKYIIMPLRSE